MADDIVPAKKLQHHGIGLGQGTFFFASYNPLPAGPYEGQIHFDPD